MQGSRLASTITRSFSRWVRSVSRNLAADHGPLAASSTCAVSASSGGSPFEFGSKWTGIGRWLPVASELTRAERPLTEAAATRPASLDVELRNDKKRGNPATTGELHNLFLFRDVKSHPWKLNRVNEKDV